jgi:serine O-acetyltransferase
MSARIAAELEPALSRAGSLGQVVAALCEANRRPLPEHQGHGQLPAPEALEAITSELRAALFPWHFGARDLSDEGLPYFVGRTLHAALRNLEQQIRLGFAFACRHATALPCLACSERASEVAREFATRLPALRTLLGADALAAFENDPAATSPDEAIFCYPGATAMFHHRLAHELFVLGVPLIPRLLSELAHAKTGIDIHPGARIGGCFFIDHGTGVVVGETCIIGERVRLYQGVTLGARSFPKDENGRYLKGIARHPIVEDDVIIYAGATVLGRITIGRGATIGGNVWVTDSVAPGARVSQAQLQRQWFSDGAGI